MFVEIAVASSLIIACAGISYFENNCIGVSGYHCAFNNLPDTFKGCKILQISDLHSKSFGKNQKRLVKRIIKEKPDYIFITGDIIDVDKDFKTIQKRFERVRPLLESISVIAPTFYTTGNHEIETGYKEYLWQEAEKCGTNVVVNKCVRISRGGKSIAVIGAADPCFYGSRKAYKPFAKELKKLCAEAGGDFKTVLSHRPELIDVYSECGADLVFTGHAHGGQFRTPFTSQGLYSPEQGVLPRYTQGVHRKDATTMVVSRGMGNSRFPQRLFNRPEIVAVTLK